MLAVTAPRPEYGRMGGAWSAGPGRPDARADRPGRRRPSALGAAFALAGLAMIPWVC